jgi:hypothetical protein
MAAADPGALSQFLNYGGLGLLAILCLVVLGYNVWSLNALVAKADPKRISAARPLLLGQMAISLIGLLSVGAGGIYLDRMKVEDSRMRTVQVLLDPWDPLADASNLPAISIAGTRLVGRPARVVCTPGEPTTVYVDFSRYIRTRIQNGGAMKSVILPIAAASQEQ